MNRLNWGEQSERRECTTKEGIFLSSRRGLWPGRDAIFLSWGRPNLISGYVWSRKDETSEELELD